MGRFDGQAAIVTGGASGIGLATARQLRSEGARVVIVDLQEEAAARAASEVDGIAMAADVGDGGTWPAIVAAAGSLGPLRLVHLNAGTALNQPDIAAVTDGDYRRITRVNLDGVVFGARAVVPAMQAAGGGAIVATSSMAGLIGFPGDPVYTATKWAVLGLVRSLAPTLSAQGITVNAVCPGLVDTPLIDGEVREVLVGGGFPLIGPEAVADAVVALMAGEATGRVVVVQAGMPPTAHRFAPVASADDPSITEAVPAQWRPGGAGSTSEG